MPDGVPASQVGALLFDHTGAELVANGFIEGNWAGADCSPGTNGSYATDSSGDLILTSSGSGNCAMVRSNATYNAGIYEARIYVSPAWDGFWMSGPSWPANGEIDGMEVLGGQPSTTYHSPSGSSGTVWPGPAAPGWYTVDIVRSAGTVTVYWNGAEVRQYSESTATDPENVFLDVTDGPGSMKVADVKIWSLAS